MESLQEWQDAFVTELEQRLDRAELDWPARFAQVRAANGAGDPFGLTYFTTAAENFRAQTASLRGRTPNYWVVQSLIRTAWGIEMFESLHEVDRLDQKIGAQVMEFRQEWGRLVQQANERHGSGSLDAEVEISDARQRLQPEEEQALARVVAQHLREGQRMAAERRELVGRLKGLAESSWLPCHPWLAETIRIELDRFSLDTQTALNSGRGFATWELCEAPGSQDGVIARGVLIEGFERIGFRDLLHQHPLAAIEKIPVAEAPASTSQPVGLRLTERFAFQVQGANWLAEPEGAGPPAPVPTGTALAFEADFLEPVRGGIYTVEVRAASDNQLLGSFQLIGGCDEPLARMHGKRPYLRRVAPSPPPLQNDLPAELVGTWEVRYEDTELGAVRGRALLTEEEGVRRLRLVHPKNGGSHLLRLEGLREDFDSGGWQLSFVGDSPYASEAEPGGLPLNNPVFQPIDVPADEQAVVFVLGDFRYTLDVEGNELPPADLDRVTVTLAPEDTGGGLSGNWSYAANPQTQRARDGRGRVGSFDAETGRVQGTESWTPVVPELLFVDVVSDQTGHRDAMAPGLPYPFGEDGGSPRRFLAIYGKGLAQHRLDPHQLESESAHIRYSVHAFPEDAIRSQEAKDWQRRAKESLANNTRLSAALRSEIAGITPLIVRAELVQGVLPEFALFSVDGERAAWPLMFAGLGGGLDFVRQFESRWEPIRSFYLPDELAIELRLTEPLPLDEIPIELFENYDADRQRPAYLVGGTPGRMVLKRTEQPGVYRSVPFQVVSQRRLELAPPPRAGVVRLALVDPEDSAGGVGGIQAKLPEDFQVERFLLPVAGEPIELAGQERPGLASDWNRAILEALACRENLWIQARRLVRGLPDSARSLTGTDWDLLARETQDRLLDLDLNMTFAWPLIGEAPVVSTKIQVGHHAAMILLRREFASQLRGSLNQYRQLLQDPAALERYRLTLSQQHITDEHPLAVIEIQDPKGGKADFAMLTWPPAWEDPRFLNQWGIGRQAAFDWHREQTELAVRRMVGAMEASLATLEAPECDATDLLYSAAISYGVTARAVLPRLVKPAEGPQGQRYWVPDTQARFWVESIPNLYQTTQLRRSEAQLDTFFLNLQLAGAGLATAGSRSALAMAITRADIGVALATVIEEGNAYLDGQLRTTITRGASALLGPEVYCGAEREARSLQAAIFNSMLSVGGVLLPKVIDFAVGRQVDAAIPNGRPIEIETRAPGPRTRTQPEPELPPHSPFRGAEEPVNYSDLAFRDPDAHTPAPSVRRTVVEPQPSHQPPEFLDIEFPSELPDGVVPPIRKWTAPDGRVFELQPRGRGNMSRVYDVKSIDGRAPPEPLVLKDGVPSNFPAQQLMEDVAHGSDVLKERGILHLEVKEAVLAGDSSYVLQQRAGPGDVLLSRDDLLRQMKSTGAARQDMLSPHQRRAAAELYDQLGRRGVASVDAHVDNVFFRGEGLDMRAGILDTDMTFELGHLSSARMEEMVMAQMTGGGTGGGVWLGGQHGRGGLGLAAGGQFANAHEFNLVVMQRKGWLKPSQQGLGPSWLTPDDLAPYTGFDLSTTPVVD